MPLYEYKCVKCGHRFEKLEPGSSSPRKKCPRCGAKAERQISSSAIQFKGSGWYVTDYASAKPSATAETDATGDKAAAKPAETKATETKPPSEKKSEKKKK